MNGQQEEKIRIYSSKKIDGVVIQLAPSRRSLDLIATENFRNAFEEVKDEADARSVDLARSQFIITVELLPMDLKKKS